MRGFFTVAEHPGAFLPREVVDDFVAVVQKVRRRCGRSEFSDRYARTGKEIVQLGFFRGLFAVRAERGIHHAGHGRIG